MDRTQALKALESAKAVKTPITEIKDSSLDRNTALELLDSQQKEVVTDSIGITRKDALEAIESYNKGNPQQYDLSNGTANVPTQEYLKVFTPEVDDILSSNAFTDEGLLKPIRSLKYGYLQSSSNLYNILSNIPGGVNRFKNFMTGQTSKSPEELLMSDDRTDQLNLMEQAEKYLKTIAYDVAPKGITDDRLIDKIYQGVGSTPVTVAQYIPATRAAGVLAKPLSKITPTKLKKLNDKYFNLVNPTSMGLAATDILATSDQGFGDASIAGIKGLILGNALKGTEGLNVNARITTLGTLGFASTEGSFDDRVSGAVTFGLLGGFGRLEGRTLKEINRDFKDTYEFRKGVLENRYNKEYIETSEKFKVQEEKEQAKMMDYLNKVDILTQQKSIAEKALEKGEKSINQKGIDDIQKSIDKYNTLLEREIKKNKITKPYFDAITAEKMDIRNAVEVFKDLFYTVKEGKNLKTKKKYKDIDDGTIASIAGKYLLPPKFMKNHPLPKYIADRVSLSKLNGSLRFNDLIKSDKINDVKYKYEGDVASRFSFVPGMKYTKIKADPNSYEGTLKNITSKEAYGVMEAMIKIEQRYVDFINANKKDKAKMKYFFDKKGNAKVNLVEKEYGLNENQMKHYLAKRYAYDLAHKDLIATLTESGAKTNIPKSLPNFMVHAFPGEYRVYAKKETKKGDVTIQTYGVESSKQAKQLIEKLKEKDADLNYNFNKRDMPSDRRAIDQFSEVFGYIKNDSKATAALDTAYREFLLKNLPKHFMKRKKDRYITGFAGTNPFKSDVKNVEEFHRAEIQYFDGITQAIEKIKFDRDVNFVLNHQGKAKNLYPNAVTLSKAVINNAFGRENNKFTRGVDKLIENYTPFESAGKFFDGVNRFTLVSKLLAYNVRFGTASFLQPYQMVIPRLRRLNDLGITTENPWNSLFQAYRDMFLPSKEAKQVIKYFAEEGGLASAKFLDEFNSVDFLGKIQVSTKDVLSKKGKKKIGKGRVIEVLSGKKIAAHIEMYSRTIAGLMFYNHLKKAGYDTKSAMKNAAYQANNAMVEYDAEVRPLLYGPETGLGYIGKSAGLFKTFQHNYLAQMVEYIKTTQQTGNISGLQGFIGSMIMYSGLLGVVGIGATDQLIRGYNAVTGSNNRDMTTFLMDQGFPDWALFGGVSGVADVNISTTTAAPGLASDQLISFPGFEYVGGIGKEMLVLANKARLQMQTDGMLTPKDFLIPLKAALPNSLHGIIELYYNSLAQGKPMLSFLNTKGEEKTIFLDAKKNLRAYPPREASDWYKKIFLTATSVDEARNLKALFHYSRFETQSNKVDDKYVAMAVSTFLSSGGEFIPQSYYDIMASEGYTKKQADDKIINKLKSLKETSLDKFLKKKPSSVKAIEEVEMLERMLGNQ